MAAELIFNAENVVGESLVWDAARQRLLWVDIVGKSIHALDPTTGEHQRWQTPDFVTSVGLRKDGGAVVAFTKTICLWDYGDEFRTLATIEPELPGNRLNEGVVGPDGSFWVGTMQNNIAADGSPIEIRADTGQLFRCAPNGQVRKLTEDRFGITNTLVWTDDGHLITADTPKNAIYRYAVDLEASAITNRTVIVADFERGLPDGSAPDAAGHIWNCRVVGGGCLLRFDAAGQIERIVDLPCNWPTSCAFGGAKLDTLYVTSARFTMTPEHLDANPQEGGLFALDPCVVGRPDYRFG